MKILIIDSYPDVLCNYISNEQLHDSQMDS